MTDTPGHALDRDALASAVDERLAGADEDLARRYPGPAAGRQPVHTVYVPAHLFGSGFVATYGRAALNAVIQHADVFLDLIGGDEALLGRVLTKLENEPVEDLRIDFEDGYGDRGDDEEDATVTAASTGLREDLDKGLAPPFVGIRFKSLEQPTRRRGIGTLTAFVEAIARDGRLPDGFVVTLPKATSVEQVEAMAWLCGEIEGALGLGDHTLAFEIQVETPQAVVGPDGRALVGPMIEAADGRCTGLHYGTYDYSASLGIAAAHQGLDHPVADHAKAVMLAAAAGTGVRLADGSTNVLPVGDVDTIRSGWALHLSLVRRSLERGYYQGWDLHPAQLPTRYAATFAFYREGLAAAGERLRGATREVADEPATRRALADYLLRGLDCGAVSAAEVREAGGLDEAALRALARR